MRRPAGSSLVSSVLSAATAVIGVGAATAVSEASTFHLMQIEQVIGGVNGDPTAQAIQLRMRFFGQNIMTEAVLRVWDANGENPIEVVDFDHTVPNAAAGDRVLIASAGFLDQTTPTTDPDFVMSNLIPESYLDAGRLTLEDEFGTILWLLAWGGDNYTGPTNGSFTNDPDGQFGPPVDIALPSDGIDALLFDGPANATSSNNLDDYILTTGGATFTNNARQAFDLGKGGGGFTFDVTGACPGTITLAWEGATPRGNIAIIFASNTGSFVIPPDLTCGNTQLGLGSRNIQLVTTVPGGQNGSGMVNGNASAGACGGFLQLLDIGPCATSNVAQIP